jgi:hypothetical protein
MRIAHAALGLQLAAPGGWRADWAWGVALIVLNVVIHVIGLALINQRAAKMFRNVKESRHTTLVFAVVNGLAFWDRLGAVLESAQGYICSSRTVLRIRSSM